jgi:predicted phosphodiesterase
LGEQQTLDLWVIPDNPDPMRIAVIADVHGNLIALEAVLAHLRAAAPDLVVNLGDLVSGPFDPSGSADAQMNLACPTIAGNHERQLLEGGTGASDAFARPRLSSSQMNWIGGLPESLSLVEGQVFACHGSPGGGDLEYLLEDVSTGYARLDTIEAIQPRLEGIGQAKVVLCGHTHMPRMVSIGDVLVVNPGSVGLPGYRDSKPVPHVMEAGMPHARYAIVERCDGGWAAELRAVPYDYEAPARQAEQHGRPQTAYVVRTGWMPPV